MKKLEEFTPKVQAFKKYAREVAKKYECGIAKAHEMLARELGYNSYNHYLEINNGKTKET